VARPKLRSPIELDSSVHLVKGKLLNMEKFETKTPESSLSLACNWCYNFKPHWMQEQPSFNHCVALSGIFASVTIF